MNASAKAATHCFFSSQRASHGSDAFPYIVAAIDLIDPDTNLGVFSHESLAQVQARYADARIVTIQECERLREEAVIKAPWAIDEDRFYDLLEVLPPCRWTRHSDQESFYVSERITGCVVTWAVRIGRHCFELQDLSTLSHADVVRACLVTLAKEHPEFALP